MHNVEVGQLLAAWGIIMLVHLGSWLPYDTVRLTIRHGEVQVDG